jgi:hypothetical protein
MHRMFTDWYQQVRPAADRQTIERRWAGIEGCLTSLDFSRLADLSACVARRTSSVEWFREVLKGADEVMPTRGVDEEVRVLAAVVLRLSVEQQDDKSVVAALGLLTGAFGTKDEPDWLGEHRREAAKELARVGREDRQVTQTTQIAELSIAGVNAAIRETNDCLWWAFTGYSAALKLDYKTLGLPGAALVAPVELWQVIRTVPHSPETEALLLHVLFDIAGDGGKEYSFKNHLSALGREQAQAIRKQLPAQWAVLCPVLWAIAAVADGRSWITEFEKLFKFRSTAIFNSSAVAIQVLREACLIDAASA